MISFFVPGHPSGAGSKRYAGHPGDKPLLLDMGGQKTDSWRAVVAMFANQAHRGPLLKGPLGMSVVFYFDRPKSHYKKNGSLRPDAPVFYCVKKRNDSDKLLRSTGDALSGVLYDDDSSVSRHHIERRYIAPDGKTGAQIRVWDLRDDGQI